MQVVCAVVQIEPRLMPDALHPNAEGMELFARCMAPAVDELFAAASGGGRRGLWKLGG
jgi:lysophospholipase L1-like esterase